MIDPDRFNNFLNVSSAQLHGTIALLENLVEWGKIQVQPQSLAPGLLSLKELVDGVFTELTLIREFVEKAGGSIKVQSTEGRGSSFIIELPLSQ